MVYTSPMQHTISNVPQMQSHQATPTWFLSPNSTLPIPTCLHVFKKALHSIPPIQTHFTAVMKKGIPIREVISDHSFEAGPYLQGHCGLCEFNVQVLHLLSGLNSLLILLPQLRDGGELLVELEP